MKANRKYYGPARVFDDTPETRMLATRLREENRKRTERALIEQRAALKRASRGLNG